MMMRTNCDNQTGSALSRVEVLTVLAVLAILAVLFLSALSGAKGIAKKISCMNNLKQVGLAFRIFANDHEDYYPMQLPVKEGGTKECVEFGLVTPHFLVISNGLSTPELLVCPADKRVPAVNLRELRGENISYFVGLNATDTNVHSLLSGDRNIDDGSTFSSRIMVLSSNRAVKWKEGIHRNSGNVLMGDGSAQQPTSQQLGDLLRDSGVATNRLLIP